MPAHLEHRQSHPIPERKFVIAIEGVDGAGKTTVSKRVVEELAKVQTRSGLRPFWTCQPTHTGAGKVIRDQLGKLSGRELLSPLKKAELAALFAADRLAHWTALHAILTGDIADVVISDRWFHSSLVYQGLRDRFAWWSINLMNREVPPPTLTIILDLPAEIAFERVKARGMREPFALEELRHFAQTYRTMPERVVSAGENGPHKFAVIDGTMPTEIIVEDVLRRIDEACR